ncbi:MAG: hypothetical protein PVS2B2_26750 [Candidatus Acidiferrum sp.]
MIHISRGLLQERKPQCRDHGNTMRLRECQEPFFKLARSENSVHTKRKYYKCKVKGCYFVAAGPTEYRRSTYELSLDYVRPW